MNEGKIDVRLDLSAESPAVGSGFVAVVLSRGVGSGFVAVVLPRDVGSGFVAVVLPRGVVDVGCTT